MAFSLVSLYQELCDRLLKAGDTLSYCTQDVLIKDSRKLSTAGILFVFCDDVTAHFITWLNLRCTTETDDAASIIAGVTGQRTNTIKYSYSWSAEVYDRHRRKLFLICLKKKEALWPCQHISALKRRRSLFVPVSLETWTRGMSLVVWKVAKSKCYLSNLLEMETDVQSNQSVFYMGAQSHYCHKQLQAIWFAFEYLYRLNSTYLNINAGTTRDYNTREWKIIAATRVGSIISNMDGAYGSEKWSRCSSALNLHSF